MLPKLRPAHGLAAGLMIVGALGLAARYIVAPLPFAPAPASPPISVRAHASPHPMESERIFSSEPPPLPSEPPSTSFGDTADPGILLVRQCLALAGRDPLAAMEMAEANGLHEVDSGLAASLMAQWASQDFARAYEWTKMQEPGAWRDDMLAHLAYVRAQADPVAAARLAMKDISAGPARDEAIMSVIHQWALKDPGGAGLWVQSLPDEPLRKRATAEITAIAAYSHAQSAR